MEGTKLNHYSAPCSFATENRNLAILVFPSLYQSRTQIPQALWPAVGCLERD